MCLIPICKATSANSEFLNSLPLPDKIFLLPPNLQLISLKQAFTTTSAVFSSKEYTLQNFSMQIKRSLYWLTFDVSSKGPLRSIEIKSIGI